MQKSKLNKYIIYFIMIFPLVIPEGLATLSSTAYTIIFKYGRIVSFFIILLLYISKLRHGRAAIPVQLRYMFVLAIYCLMVSIIGGHGWSDWLSAFWPCLMAGILAEYGKKDTDVLINTLLVILEFWTYVNFIFVILYPDGMYVSTTIGYTKNWILGYKSSFQYILFPAVILGWIRSSYSGRRLRFWLLLIIAIAEAFRSENAMLVVAFAVVAICYVFKLIEIKRFFNSFIYSIVIFVVNMLFIFGLTMLVNTRIGSLFLGYYGKSTTLGGRASYIWPITIQKIAQNPIFGYGVWSSEERRALYLNRPAAIHAHNQLLEMLFVGGIIFLIIYTLFFVKMYRESNSHSEKSSTKIIMFGLFVLFCMMSVEIYMRHTGFPIWIMINLAFITSEIDAKFSVRFNKTMKHKRNRRIRLKIR